MGLWLPDVRPGDPASAGDRNRLIRSVREAGGLRAGAGIVTRDTAGGRMIARSLPWERTRIKLTGTYASGYPWKEVVRSGGGWFDTGRTGSAAVDPAFELNDDTSLTSGDTVYWAQRSACSATPEWVFWEQPGGGGGGPHCLCWFVSSIPSTLNWTYVAKYFDGSTYYTLGTTSGTLAWTTSVSYGTAPCVPTMSGISGFVGDFSYYTTGTIPGSGAPPAVLVNNCSTVAPGGFSFPQTRCRSLMVLCQSVLTDDSPSLRDNVLYGTFYVDPLLGNQCIIKAVTNRNPDDVSESACVPVSCAASCSPYSLQVTYHDGSILTISE